MAPAFLDRGAEFVGRFTDFSAKKDIPPPLSEQTALLCSVVHTILYVAPFYLSPKLRSTPLSGRDAPSVIQARVRAVIMTCVACTVITSSILITSTDATPEDLLRLFGFWPVNRIDNIKVVALVAILFIGPLYETLIVDGDWRSLTPYGFRQTFWTSWIGFRNLVVAPLSEELVFRSLTISLFLVAKVSPTRIVLLSPLVFGVAHIHHLIDFLRAHTPPRRNFPPFAVWVNGLIRSIFQFTYTSLFGFFSAFVFLRTGNFWAATLAHSFCNCMGFPRVWGRVGQYHTTIQQITPDLAQGKRDEDAANGYKVGNGVMQKEDEDTRNRAVLLSVAPSIAWSVIYYALLVAGAWSFYELLWPLTESEGALASFD